MKNALTIFFAVALVAGSYAGLIEEPPCDTPSPPKPTPPETKCGQNEELSQCKRSCPPETCSILIVTPSCATEPCTTGCVCKDGFLRKKEGSPCLSISECPTAPKTPNIPAPTKPTPPPTSTGCPKKAQ